MSTPGNNLSPWPVRIIAYILLIALAVASIWLIDRRAMQRQHELESQQQQGTVTR